MIPLYEHNKDEIRVFKAVNIVYPPHLHTEFEVLYMLEGDCIVGLSGGGESHVIQTGGLFIAFPHVTHTYMAAGGSDGVGILALCRPGGSIAAFTKGKQPVNPVLPPETVPEDVKYAMRGLLAEKEKGQSDSTVMQAFIQLAIGRILPLLKLTEATVGDDLLYQAVAYVSEHYRNHLTLDVLARQVGVSKYHLSRLFNDKLKIGFSQYVSSLRLNLAIDMLRCTDWSVGMVSDTCGFESRRTFNRVFLKEYHMTPRAYRGQI